MKIKIPETLQFEELRLARDASGDVSFSWEPIEKLCEYNNLDIATFRETHEDNVADLIIIWYAAHKAAGGKLDATAEDLIDEVRLEDEYGGGVSHPPGRG